MNNSGSIYLDHAAGTPVDIEVAQVMVEAASIFANPSSPHSLGRQSHQQLEGARKDIAKVLGAKPQEIVFTSGSTEAANLAIQGVARQFPGAGIIASAIEHEAVLECLDYLSQGHQTDLVPVDPTGLVNPDAIRAKIDDSIALICLMYANNEIGSIQPISRVSQLLNQIRADRRKRGIKLPLYLYVDAAQAGLLPLAVSRLGVDLMSMGGSKIYGPAGTGFLYVRSGTKLDPLFFGGGQELGRRSGTENVIGALGLAAAITKIQSDRASESKRQAKLRDHLWGQLSSEVPNLTLNGDLNHRLEGNINFSVRGVSGEALVAYLDREGICGATGSACTAANEEPSHVLLALGRSREQAESSIRLTLGRGTTKADIDKTVKALIKSIKRLRQLSSI